MKYRTIPGTSLMISEVGFGVGNFNSRGWENWPESKLHYLFRYAVDRGINFFDTADIYNSGRSEEILGDALSGERDRIVIATKFGYDFYSQEPERMDIGQNFSAKYIRSACEQSLKRLQTDHIDLYQIHHPRLPALMQDELYEALEKLQKAGKIISWGAALLPGCREEAHYLVTQRKAPALQIVYNLLDQNLGRELFALRNNRTHFLARLPHAEGLLDGKGDPFTADFEGESQSQKDWYHLGLRQVEQLKFLIRPGRSLAQAALKFILANSWVVSALPEIYGEDEINEYAVLSECPDLEPEELARLERFYEKRFGASAETSEAESKNEI